MYQRDDSNDLLTMLYWICGILIVIFIIDWVWLKPYQERKHTNKIIERLRQKNTAFYQTLPKFKNERGIVIVMNDSKILVGAITIITLRKLGCNLPILICYAGDDLSQSNRKFLKSIPNISFMAIAPKLDIPIETVRGSQIRAFSLLYSPFREVLLVEPDMLFFTNPEYLFSDPHYIQTGALFWKDRKVQSFWDKKVYDWVRKIIPYRKDDNRILDKKAGNYQSRDIILIDKHSHKKGLEKLWILAKEWETVYNYIPGDKESYWIALELATEPYYFIPTYPGIIGEVQMDVLCGHTLYHDSAGQLLCCNDSIFHNGDIRHVTDFTHYALFDGNAIWNTTTDKCIRNTNYIPISDNLKSLFNEFSKITQDINNQLTQHRKPEYNSSDSESED